MNFRSGLIGNALVVRWTGAPTAADNQAVLQQLREARRKVGVGLLFVSVLGDGVPMPDGEAREQMQAISPQIMACTDAIQLVIEGDGLLRTMLRTMVRGMGVATRRSASVMVHNSIEDFLRANAARIGVERSVFLARLRTESLD